MKRVFVLLVTLCLIAQTVVSQAALLQPFVPVEGTLAAGESRSYSFDGVSGQVVSLIAQGQDGFDPALTLLNGDGERLIGADDIDYPRNLDAFLQAITLPRTDLYTVIVSAAGGTAGTYTLALRNGFAAAALDNPLDSDTDWEASGDNVALAVIDGQLDLRASGVRARGIAAFTDFEAADVAVQADITTVRNPSGWTAGVVARRSGDNYYLYEVNDEGRWRFSAVSGANSEVISDWRAHPAIRPGETAFTLLLMAHDTGFDFFYNGAFVGSLSDSSITAAGQIGLSAGTTSSLQSETRATVDRVFVTTPVLLEGERIIPQEVQTGDATTVAQQLIRRHVAGADGVMALTVPEAEVTYARPGVNPFMLGQGTTYTNFAMGGTVNIQSPSASAGGCGLIFRYQTGDSYMLAFLDSAGAFGAAERTASGFEPGLFAQDDAPAGGEVHHLLIIANGPRLYYYVDGISAGWLNVTERAGQVGIAVANFEPAETTCAFTNLWLWEWDG